MYIIESIFYGLIIYGSYMICCKNKDTEQIIIIEPVNSNYIETPPSYNHISIQSEGNENKSLINNEPPKYNNSNPPPNYNEFNPIIN